MKIYANETLVLTVAAKLYSNLGESRWWPMRRAGTWTSSAHHLVDAHAVQARGGRQTIYRVVCAAQTLLGEVLASFAGFPLVGSQP